MRVLIADDHSLFRDGLTSLLEAAGLDVVAEAGNGQAAVQETLRLRPDLVLLDIAMPEMNGLEALRQIKQQLPETRVVMLTASDEDADLFAAIKAGAQGYLQKDLSSVQFLEMLDGLQQDKAAMTRDTTTRLMNGFVTLSQDGSKVAESLTDREIELVQLLAAGLPNKGIARRLCISENTVKYHVKNILRKLNVQNRTEAVAYAMRDGLLKPGSPG